MTICSIITPDNEKRQSKNVLAGSIPSEKPYRQNLRKGAERTAFSFVWTVSHMQVNKALQNDDGFVRHRFAWDQEIKCYPKKVYREPRVNIMKFTRGDYPFDY